MSVIETNCEREQSGPAPKRGGSPVRSSCVLVVTPQTEIRQVSCEVSPLASLPPPTFAPGPWGYHNIAENGRDRRNRHTTCRILHNYQQSTPIIRTITTETIETMY